MPWVDIGHGLVVWTWVVSAIAAVAWFKAIRNQHWEQAARWLTGLHVAGIALTLVILVGLFMQDRFEVLYVWKYSKRDMEPLFKIAAFWSGQEGSFLLWALWQGIVLLVLMRTLGPDLRALAMGFGLLSQVFLLSMVVGLPIGPWVLGSSPFVLLKEAYLGDVIFYVRPDYVPPDGNGLNPLLRNYWMVIHPPMLFLGYAVALPLWVIGIAGMIRRAWERTVYWLHYWLLWVVGLLGFGIALGAVWAYESLSFGGYWAWDPVENASLVPWLLAVAGLHLVLIYRARKQHLRLILLFAGLVYSLVLYSSFLTRSGILGESSVHSFTDLGLSGQLLAYLLFFTALYVGVWLWHWRNIPAPSAEETISTREFWMFTGAMVVFLSAFQVFVDMSRPVWNAILGTDWAPPADPVAYYNRWQLPFAVVILWLSGLSLLLPYRRRPSRKEWMRMAEVLIASILLTALIAGFWRFRQVSYVLLLHASVWAMLAALAYWMMWLKRKWRYAGGAIAHLGLGVLLLGVLVSSARKKELRPPGQSEGSHILLFQGQPVQADNWLLTYLEKWTKGDYTYFRISVEGADSFLIEPHVLIQGQNIVANPDITKFAGYDLFVHVNSMPLEQPHQPRYRQLTLALGDTVHTEYGVLQLVGLTPYRGQDNELGLVADFLLNTGAEIRRIQPTFILRGNEILAPVDTLYEGKLALRFRNILVHEEKYVFDLWQVPRDDWIVVRAIVFPWINLVWLGGILIIMGSVWSVIARRWQKR